MAPTVDDVVAQACPRCGEHLQSDGECTRPIKMGVAR